jgi:hypothetical protein
MCSPTQAAMSGLQMGSSYMAQKGAADMQEFRNEAATKSANAALRQDNEILIRRTQEEREAFAQSNFDRQRRAMEIKATANVAAGEAGVADGISTDRIMANVDRQSGEIGVRGKKSFESSLESIGDTYDKSVANMVSRIQGLPPVNQPNPLALAFSSFSPMVTDEMVAKSDAAINNWWDNAFNKGETA